MLEMTIVEIRDEYDIVVARMEAKEEARKIGFGIVDQTRIATAVSELATSLSMEEVRDSDKCDKSCECGCCGLEARGCDRCWRARKRCDGERCGRARCESERRDAHWN